MNAVYTIGHSTRTIDEFIKILKPYNIETVVDVRTIAASRHNPQYNEEDLCKSLSRKGIGYIHCKGLGGLRHTTKASINTAWENSSFRGYADYIQTPQFQENLNRLIDIIKDKPTVIMCAETLPWRCHRSLIGDALLVLNIEVIDIINEKTSKPHLLTSFAKVKGNRIVYPKDI
ncbi:MAG: DNA repair protein [Deltaproteobacteria bacterium HGW-Deltaproteobacteria-1]|jgi:uncharacterized protein (DUF488 family)|nr:MAG: DNA repair protein [Deltaproteobacteria bacterium HGW-Deltaproteobacteria-1]